MLTGKGNELQTDLLVFGHNAKTFHDFTHETHDISLLKSEVELSVFQFVHFQQLIHESQHTIGASLHVAHGLFQGGRQVPCLSHSFHGTLNDGERGAEFMTYVHEETLFEFAHSAVDADAVTQTVSGYQQPCDIPDDSSSCQEVEYPSPPSVPPRLTDNDHHLADLFWMGGQTHTEDIASGFEVFIDGLILTVGGTPVAVESLQHVFVFRLIRELKTQIRETEDEGVLAVVEGDGNAFVAFFRFIVVRCSIYRETGDLRMMDDGGCMVGEGIGLENHQTMFGTEEKSSVRQQTGGVLAIDFSQFVGREIIAGKFLRLFLHTRQTAVRTNPEISPVVGNDGICRVVRQSLSGGDLLELERFGGLRLAEILQGSIIETAAGRCQPNGVFMFEDVANLIIAQCTVLFMVITIGIGMDFPTDRCHGIRMEDHETVGTSNKDITRMRLMKNGHRTHEGVLRQQAAELITAIRLWEGEA